MIYSFIKNILFENKKLFKWKEIVLGIIYYEHILKGFIFFLKDIIQIKFENERNNGKIESFFFVGGLKNNRENLCVWYLSLSKLLK